MIPMPFSTSYGHMFSSNLVPSVFFIFNSIVSVPEREYVDFQDQKTFGNRVDSTDGTVSIDESRSGNSGIFAKQDFIQREIRLRLNNRIIPIMVRMVVDAINSGVWEDDDILL